MDENELKTIIECMEKLKTLEEKNVKASLVHLKKALVADVEAQELKSALGHLRKRHAILLRKKQVEEKKKAAEQRAIEKKILGE